jgi:hypothetical protein
MVVDLDLGASVMVANKAVLWEKITRMQKAERGPSYQVDRYWSVGYGLEKKSPETRYEYRLY